MLPLALPLPLPALLLPPPPTAMLPRSAASSGADARLDSIYVPPKWEKVAAQVSSCLPVPAWGPALGGQLQRYCSLAYSGDQPLEEGAQKLCIPANAIGLGFESCSVKHSVQRARESKQGPPGKRACSTQRHSSVGAG